MKNIPQLSFEKFAQMYCERQEQTVDGLKSILESQKQRFSPGVLETLRDTGKAVFISGE